MNRHEIQSVHGEVNLRLFSSPSLDGAGEREDEQTFIIILLLLLTLSSQRRSLQRQANECHVREEIHVEISERHFLRRINDELEKSLLLYALHISASCAHFRCCLCSSRDSVGKGEDSEGIFHQFLSSCRDNYS